jgi:hypothetical protein
MNAGLFIYNRVGDHIHPNNIMKQMSSPCGLGLLKDNLSTDIISLKNEKQRELYHTAIPCVASTRAFTTNKPFFCPKMHTNFQTTKLKTHWQETSDQAPNN